MATFSDNMIALKAANATLIAANAKANGALVDITADVSGLAKIIKDLKDQLAQGGVLTTADLADMETTVAQTVAAATGTSMVADTAKTVADMTPNPPPPPPPPQI